MDCGRGIKGFAEGEPWITIGVQTCTSVTRRPQREEQLLPLGESYSTRVLKATCTGFGLCGC